MLGKSKITYIGDTILQPGKHVVFVDAGRFRSPCKDDNYQIFIPDGYRIVNYCHPYYIPDGICFENVDPVKVKVYKKKDQRFCPEIGIPVREQ